VKRITEKSLLSTRMLPIIAALVLVGLSGCGIAPVTGPPSPSPQQIASQGGPGEGLPAEVQIAFTADRTSLRPGECATLEWDVEGGFGVELDGKRVGPTGQKQVCPQETTTYRLGVDAGEAIERKEILIAVSDAGGAAPETPPEATVTPLAVSAASVHRDLEYAIYELDGAKHGLLLDLYLPQRNESQLSPVLVFIHGGGWIEGTKESCPAATFTQRGYAMACVEYRLAGGFAGCSAVVTFPAQIRDVKAAVRWLRQNADQYGLDPDRFGAIGNSSGGHLAALLGVSHGAAQLAGEHTGVSDAVQAVCDWYGPVDVTQPPPTIVFEDDPPFLVIHGEVDGMVPIEQSELLVDALEDMGAAVSFVRLPNAGHGFGGSGQEVAPEFLDPMLAFFDAHLRDE
jgi:acetyl esterase/lipase